MDSEKLWTKDFITVSVINFFIYFIFFSFMATIAAYAMDHFQVSISRAGLAAGIFVLGAVGGRLATGRIIENKGSKRVLVAGTIFLFLTSLLYFAAVNFPMLIITRLLNGMAYGVAATAAGTIVAQIIPSVRRGEGIGIFSTSIMLATALGPFAGLLLIHSVDFRIMFVMTSIIALLGVVLSFMVGKPAAGSFCLAHTQAGKSFHLSNVLEFQSLSVSTIAFIIGFIYSGILIFLSLYSREIHLEKAAGLFFPVFAVTTLATRPFSGRLLDVIGSKRMIPPLFLMFLLGMLFLSRAANSFFLLSAAILIGLGYGNLVSCLQALAIKAIAPQRLGVATATYFAFLDSGIGIGPYFLGFLVPLTGFRGLFFFMSFLVAATMLLDRLLNRNVSSET